MFPLADTLRLPVFPSLRFRRNRTTFFYVSVKFPSKQTRVSASVNALASLRKHAKTFRKRVNFMSPSTLSDLTIAETRVYELETGVFKLFPSWKKYCCRQQERSQSLPPARRSWTRVNFAGMPAVKTDKASVAGDFCSHIGTVSQAAPAVMSQVARRHMRTTPIKLIGIIYERCSLSFWSFTSMFSRIYIWGNHVWRSQSTVVNDRDMKRQHFFSQ